MPASPTDPAKDAALVVDGATGRVLYARNETAERHPASLTKMMTLYLLFDALKAGKVTMQHAAAGQLSRLDPEADQAGPASRPDHSRRSRHPRHRHPQRQ